MKPSTLVHRLPPLAAAAILAAAVVGCAYVDPAARNPGRKGDQTRAETIGAGRRLAAKLFASEAFKARYAAKRAEKPAGALPVLQLAFFKSDDPGVRVPSNDFVRLDLQEALADSGWFTLSRDLDACDYVLDGTYKTYKETDGSRVSHRVTLRLKDIRTGELVWTASDEIAKE